MPKAHLEISVTELPQFRRLVELLAEVECYAVETDDYTLKAIIEDCFEDLAGMEEQ